MGCPSESLCLAGHWVSWMWWSTQNVIPFWSLLAWSTNPMYHNKFIHQDSRIDLGSTSWIQGSLSGWNLLVFAGMQWACPALYILVYTHHTFVHILHYIIYPSPTVGFGRRAVITLFSSFRMNFSAHSECHQTTPWLDTILTLCLVCCRCRVTCASMRLPTVRLLGGWAIGRLGYGVEDFTSKQYRCWLLQKSIAMFLLTACTLVLDREPTRSFSRSQVVYLWSTTLLSPQNLMIYSTPESLSYSTFTSARCQARLERLEKNLPRRFLIAVGGAGAQRAFLEELLQGHKGRWFLANAADATLRFWSLRSKGWMLFISDLCQRHLWR